MPIKLVVGLGNPGSKFEGTRHNIGRRVIERLAKIELAAKLLVTEGFMNQSGGEVAEKARKNGLGPDQVLIVVDEFQIPLGQIKILKSGSGGGHNGLQSVVDVLGTQDIPRLRIGIGPLPQGEDPAVFVLKRFTKPEEEQMSKMLPEICDAVTLAVEKGIEVAMNRYNKQAL